MPSNMHEWQLFFSGVAVGMGVSVIFGVTMLIYSVRAVAANIIQRFSVGDEDEIDSSVPPLRLYESEQIPYWFRRL